MGMENFDINRFFKILCNCKLYICFVLILFIVMGYFYSFYYVTPLYDSSATVVLVQNENLENENNDFSITQADIALNQNLLSTYTKIAKSTKVLEQVINNLNLDISANDLSNLVSVEAVNNAEVFKISVVNEDKFLAASITSELLNVFSNEVQSLYNMNNVYTIDMAKVNDTPYNVNHFKDIIIFAFIGIFASLGIVIIVYLLDTTIKSEHEVEYYTKLPVLSTIPKYLDNQSKTFSELIVNAEPKSPIAECFKTFRTNIMFSIQNKKLNTILVTSGSMGEGKSFVSSNLAVSFAKSGKKVILVDTDMRKGRVHKIFNLMNNAGLSNVLSNIGINGSTVNINNYIQKSGVPNLHIMTSGDVPPNPSELLSSINMRRFLEALNTQYDIVICDGTPCTLVTDSVILSKIVDTTVIVTAAKISKLDTLNKIKKSITIVGGNIGGVVINKMPISAKSYQNKYYYGNHNEVYTGFDMENDMDDSLLDNVLCISEDVFIDTEIEPTESLDTDYDSSNYENNNFDKLSNILLDNSKDIAELKGLYKNVVQDSLDIVYKNENAASVMKQIENIKELYQSNIDTQNEYIAVIDDKISNFRLEENSNAILDELNSIKASYEDAINYQNEYIAELDSKIADIDVDGDTNTNAILDELNNIKTSYENAISSQNEYIDEYISDLNDRIASFNVTDNFSSILSELNNIKNSYEDSINSQNEYLSGKVEDNSNAVLDELYNFKISYEEGISSQNEYIARKVRNNSNSILDELNNMKSTYENSINSQTEYLDKKVGNNSSVILDKLNNIKNSYEDSINSQNEYLSGKVEDNSNAVLDELYNFKISYEEGISSQNEYIARKVRNNSNSILDELNNMKSTYENSINSQTEYLDKKVGNNSSVILDKLNNIKNSYEDSIVYQNAYIDERIENNSNNILDELNNIKASYENAINYQTRCVAELDNRIANLGLDDDFNIVLDELNTIKATYQDAIMLQTEYIAELDNTIANFRAELDNTIANFKLEDNFSLLLNELNTIKVSYENAVNSQNSEFTNLKDGISNINNNDVLSAVSNIYKQLENINSKFDYLEKKSKDNEALIKKMVKENTERSIKVTDIRKLDDKVVRMKDYLKNISNLDNSSSNDMDQNNDVILANSIVESVNTETIKTTQKEETVKEKPAKVVNADKITKKQEIAEEKPAKLAKADKVTKKEEIVKEKPAKLAKTNKVTKKEETINEKNIQVTKTDKIREDNISKGANVNEQRSSVVDYSIAKSKMKKGFFGFASRHEEEDEPINIVSQILCKNNEESVG